MWGKKDMTRKGSQNRTNQCKMREGQRRNTEDEGIRSRCGASHGHIKLREYGQRESRI